MMTEVVMVKALIYRFYQVGLMPLLVSYMTIQQFMLFTLRYKFSSQSFTYTKNTS